MSAIENPADQYLNIAPIGTTYVGIGGDAALNTSAHLSWDTTFAGAVTVEASNYPDVALNSATAGDWIDTGIAATNAAGGSVGGAMIQVPNNGARRLRLKVVATVAGRLRVRAHGKH